MSKAVEIVDGKVVIDIGHPDIANVSDEKLMQADDAVCAIYTPRFAAASDALRDMSGKLGDQFNEIRNDFNQIADELDTPVEKDADGYRMGVVLARIRSLEFHLGSYYGAIMRSAPEHHILGDLAQLIQETCHPDSPFNPVDETGPSL